jgi:predicted component of type VI protein secretion system
MSLRLRYNDKSIVLANGQLVVGRSVECNVVINDPLASRRHAMITKSRNGAFVTDLGSKAGVLVNGVMISGARRLATGDTIQLAGVRIVVDDIDGEAEGDPKLRTTLSPPAYTAVPAGFRLAPTPPLGLSRVETYHGFEETVADETVDEAGHEFDLARTAEAPRVAPPRSEGAARASAPDSVSRPDSSRRPEPPRSRPDSSGRPEPRSRPDSTRQTAPAPDSAVHTPRPQIAKLPPLPTFPRLDNLRALASVAEKALALNRAQEAERVLSRALVETLEAARLDEIDPQAAELAASLGAKLATALGSGRWFDYSVELYAVRAELMPAPVVDLLMTAVRKAKPIDKQAFRDYLADAQEVTGESPARRFVLHRLEGLQRILDLK